MKKIRAALYGIGAVGSLIAKFLLEKEGIEIVGAVDVAKEKVDKDLGTVLGLGKNLGITISNNIDTTLSKAKADIAIHATSSYLKDTYPQIASIVKNGVNVISTCEELSYPSFSEPALAEKLDALAKKHDVTVLGTGINPGFLMDTLVITLTAVCQKINKIEAVRVMNAGTRRLPFQKKVGAGLTVEEFKQKIESKQITGHVGLEQSIAMIADALAWKLDKIKVEPVESVIAEKPVESRDIKVDAGKVAGLKQKAKGTMKGKEVISLDFQAYIGAEEEYDAITIEGIPTVKQKIQPCVHGDIGTVAMIVNAIPKVINAPAGLLTMKDLPVPSAAVEDIRKYLK
ncbi:MAG: NADP-binding protein [Candidatus Bathyarchaeota archaeon]|jgi:4-hydroxy-tetrahydrodipicolinate reductase|nr:NADP-binding protein [Candidatus Bathyarchaeota archaeon A05DMB-5]MDH7557417.1 NADP-binding protein [Candidatus Bathyarchaeota archaeon]